MPEKLATSKQSASVIIATIEIFRSQKALAEGAIKQTSDENLHKPLDENTNSIAVIMKHLAGNMISRWTDFLTSDGEKPNRDRDDEFIDDFPDRDACVAYWDRGWAKAFEELGKLSDADLFKTITIRGEPYHVIDAIMRQVGHMSYHVGQIVQIARILAENNWNVLTVPRGKTKEFNEQMARKFKA
ncbi:MAG TPA: DinB family protein [Tepidisphaeraceae bacterium]|nr:DinB family protein [Tepidisphaeraceae bacterium]